jgi:hypothetical protein
MFPILIASPVFLVLLALAVQVEGVVVAATDSLVVVELVELVVQLT